VNSDSIFLQNTQISIEFPDRMPSFMIKQSNESDFVLKYDYLSVSEYNTAGSVVQNYPLPTVYQINEDITYLDNNTLIQKLSFADTLPNNATILFVYSLVWTASTTQYPINVNGSDFSMSNQNTVVLFDLLMTSWPFKDITNTLGATVQVTANVDPLSVGYSASSTGYSLSFPFALGNQIQAKLPSSAQVDNTTAVIGTAFTLISISQPVRANAFLSIPYFSQKAEYSAYFQIVSSTTPVNPISIIIIVALLVFFICCGTALGCFMYRQHKKSQKKYQKENDDEDTEKTSKPVEIDVKTYNSVNTTVSISDVFRMKVT